MLDAEQLVTEMDAKAQALLGEDYAAISEDMKAGLFRVIAEAVVEHITANAEVAVDVSGSTASACTAGGATGTFSGTGTGSIA